MFDGSAWCRRILKASIGRMTLAISAQICPSSGGGVESNLLSMLRSDFWTNPGVDLTLLATPAYAKDLSHAIDNRLRVVPWQLGEDVISRKFPEDVARGRRIRENLRALRPAFDAAVLAYRLLRYGWRAPTEEQVDGELQRIGVRAVHFPTSNLFRTRLPFVYEPWDLQFLHFPDFFDVRELERRQIKYAYGCTNAAVIVTPTRWVKEDIVSRLKVDPGKVVVIRRGSDYASATLSDARYFELLGAYGVEPGYAFYPGMTFPHKNHVTLFRALAELNKRGLRIPLVMTGRSFAPFQSNVERSMAEAGIADQVHALGRVSEDTLAALYRGAHAVVYPSLFEGLGLPLLEALHHRTPVLASNATCIPEVLGRAGILFDPADHVALAAAMEKAWREPEWARAPLKHATAQLKLFDWHDARRTFAALYRKISGANLSGEDEGVLAAASA
jgi:glycosyltransferase involved in cell wall biosynthesis